MRCFDFWTPPLLFFYKGNFILPLIELKCRIKCMQTNFFDIFLSRIIYFGFNFAKYGPICEKTYPQKLLTKILKPPLLYLQKLVPGGTPPPSRDIALSLLLHFFLSCNFPDPLGNDIQRQQHQSQIDGGREMHLIASARLDVTVWSPGPSVNILGDLTTLRIVCSISVLH